MLGIFFEKKDSFKQIHKKSPKPLRYEAFNLFCDLVRILDPNCCGLTHA
jgi:hypothetical protein